MNLQVIKNRILLWLKKIILYSLYFLLAFFLVSFGVLQIPPVQKTILKYYTERLSNVSGFKTTFGSVHLIWYDRFELENLQITDPEKNIMIDANRVMVNFRISSLLVNSNINIDAATVDGTKVNLVKINDQDSTQDLNINVFIKRFAKPKNSSTKNSPKVNIGEIVVNKSEFSYNDKFKDSLAPKFDYHHFKVKLDDGLIQNFKVIGDTIQFKVNSLTAIDEQTQFNVKQLSTYFRISQSSMEFLNLNLDAGNSHIQDTVILTYSSLRDLNDFNNLVHIKSSIRNTTIDPQDLALFAPGVDKIKEEIIVSGYFTGKVNKFFVRDLALNLGNTALTGNLNMDGLPSINETFINLNLKRSNIDITDLKFIFPQKAFSRLQPLGEFQLLGNFTGFVNDFVANGTFNGDFGQIQSDLNLKINTDDPALSQYKGNVQLIDFKFGTYLSDTTILRSVSMTGHIDGKGFTKESADFQLDGKISHFKIKDYDYKNIVTNARFKSQFFNGRLAINDPNLKFEAEGSIDFSKNNDLVKMKAKLDTALVHNLGFSKDYFSVRSLIDIDSKGLNVDSIFGNAFLKNTTVTYKDESLEVDSIQVTSSKLAKGRSLLLRSSFADVNLHGEYYYSTLFNDLNKLFKEFYLTIKNDRAELDTYYLTKRSESQEYDANFNIILKDINPIIKVAGLGSQVSKNTRVEGKFSNGYTSILSAYSTIDSVTYNGKLFTQNTIEFNGSKVRDSTNILAMLNINSAQQNLSKNFNTKDLFVEAIWNTDHIEVGLDFDQIGKDNNYARIRAAVDFLNDSTRIKILPSSINALNKTWQVSQENYTILGGNEWRINHLAIQNEDQKVLLEGFISQDSSKSLSLKVNNLDLSFLNSISGERFTGTLSGSAEGRDLYNNPYIQNDLAINSLTINEFLIGDISGTNIWNQRDQRFDINFSIDRLKVRTVDLKGFYNPGAAEPLQISAQLQKANLKIAEPLLATIFSNMNGTLTGKYQITGSFTDPKIKGTGSIENGQIMINYLKTLYNFTGEFGMNPNQLVFNNFKLTDKFNNPGTLDGFIAHRSFKEFSLNLDASFQNLQLLNTTARDNSLFYGQGYATGNANFFGPSSNLKISATAQTQKNTRIYIPMSSTETVDKKDFINFVAFTDSLATESDKDDTKRRKVESSGISMDINLDITPDAYTEIIFDIKSGDIIRGRGNGDIKLQLDTKGDFFMFGAVEFTQGAYNFTLYDIINKEFDIQPGSRISWYGSPYEGTMDITANYRQMASLSPILTDQSEDVVSNSQVRRKYPTDVKLKLEGQMLSPRISFDIDANELPDNIIIDGRAPVSLNFEFESFKSRLDEQELKRQVFSLIILRKFSPPDAFSTSGTLYNSVSELLSNQLSYWLTQVDQNLEIDLDLGTLDQEAFNTFQLRLSYSFLNGRLRVTRDGSFSNQYRPADNISSIAGDWTVDYLLTPDGKFKVKMYSRSNINQLTNTLGTQSAVTTGVSLLHTQNFNEVRDLWHSAREKKQKST
ncbi:MAG: translocation/assembly module TamB domain-containing protein, partial [Cyclobacteriaceae bacterium]